MSEGSIVRRGKASWRVKYELPRDPKTGGRRTAYVTVKGKRQDAEKELRRRLSMLDKGLAIEPQSVTVSEYLQGWLDTVGSRSCGRRTLHRYRQLVSNQISPTLGAVKLQALRPAQVDGWLQALAGTGLAVKTIRSAHGVLRVALNHAVATEVIERNVAAVVRAPRQVRVEIEILTADQITATLAKLAGDWLLPIATLAWGSGARRGELVALQWSDVDLDTGALRIERSFEQVGLTVTTKAPKTRAGIRTVTLPAFAIAALREHRRAMLETRVALGLGKLATDAPIFCDPISGAALKPDQISCAWAKRKLGVSFHSLRHSHASALIAAGLDAVTVSKRLGHASPNVTLAIYSHLFKNRDGEAAAALDAVMSAPGGTR